MKPEAVRAAYEAHFPPASARGLDALGVGVATSARGATVTMSSGREVVDLATGGFGYSHPRVIARVAEQIRAMPLSSRMFYSVPLARLLERIARVTPGDLQVSFFGNAGAEAVEGALKLVRGYHRKRTRVVAAINGYHGATTAALAVCGLASLRNAVSPGRQPIDATWMPYGDVAALQTSIDEQTAAVILESVQVGAGVAVPPPGYMKAVRARCDATGALFVADEVTTGLGVTGKMFGVDHDGVAPDIMVLAGALGGGVLPIGAYVATEAINSRVYDKRDPLLHANTTGGNPTACTAALAAFEAVEEEGLVAHARELGVSIAQQLAHHASRHADAISSSAAIGLVGSLFFRDVDTARAIQRASAAQGVLVRLDNGGPHPALGVHAPLTVSKAELERGLAAFGVALDSVLTRSAVVLEASQ